MSDSSTSNPLIILLIETFFILFQCLFHTWTYSADFQCFAIAFFVIMIFVKDQARGVKVSLAMMAGGMFMSSFVTWYKNMPPYPNFDASDA